jgi:peptidyl-prolyl cis-trans isomerase C
MEHADETTVVATEATAPLRVNDVLIDAAAIADERANYEGERDPDREARRSLAIRELLRQRAIALGLLAEPESLDDAAFDRLIERELAVPQPTRADCERYYQQHPARFRRNDIVYASHILFAVTNRVPVAQLRLKAEQTLHAVRAAPDTFEQVARELSNCPSAAVGGSLGQLLRGDSVPEFEHALFDTTTVGILPALVNTRFGFHIVKIERRVNGEAQPFEEAAADIAAFLDTRVRHKAMQQYVAVLAGQARIEGVDLGASGPLVQ